MPDTPPQTAQDTRPPTKRKAAWALGAALILGLVWVIWAQPFSTKPARVTVEVVAAVEGASTGDVGGWDVNKVSGEERYVLHF